MKKSTLMHKMGVSIGTLSYLSLCISGAVFAQEATEEETVERIQVTGSNIRGANLEGSQPLTVLTSEDIARTGASTISELMRTVTQARGGVGTFDTTQSGATSTSTPPGQAAASLRGIGPSSTLTLVNGRRIAASSFASGTENFFDINSIPASAVERVEILATGASAIYGADAVAGVINYILKNDYEGLELQTNYENTTNSNDHGAFNVQMLWGKNFDNGSNLTAFFDYYDRKEIRATDFSQTRDPILTNGYSYLPKNTPNIYFRSTQSGDEIGAPNCATELTTTEFGEEICAYYGNEDDFFETPLETLSGGLTYTLELDDLTWRTDVLMSRTESTSFSTPAPINQVDDREGAWIGVDALDVFDDETRNFLLDEIYIDPFDTVAGRELDGFRYDARFGTPRTVDIETDAIRLVSSVIGYINDWEWEAGALYSRSESDQIASAGIYNRYRYTAAAHGELCSNGTIAQYDASTDTLSCSGGELLAAYNPFLQGDAQNDATLALAQAQPTRAGTSEVFGIDAKINGELTQWNGNPVMLAAGVEFRREEIIDDPSIEARARAENDYLVDVFGFGSSASAADRNQAGIFAELLVPINDQVDLSLAGRYDDYNDFGSTFNPKVGLTYRPIDNLVLRGSWSTAFRAPSLTQAGVQLRTTNAQFDCSANAAVSQLFCENEGRIRSANVLELGNPALRAEESEALSVGLAYSPTENTTITLDFWQFDHEDIVDTNMTDVLARSIDDVTLRHCGVIPEGSQGISFDEDLCLDHPDRDENGDFLLDANGDRVFTFIEDSNGLIITDDGANLTEILAEWDRVIQPRVVDLPLFRDHIILLDNTGTQELKGLDWNITHDIELESSVVELGFSGTHYLEYERNRPGSDEIESLAGQFRYPETIANFELFYVAEDWYVGTYVFFTSSYQDDIIRLRAREIDELIDNGVITEENQERDISSWTTVTLSAGYYFDNAELRLTVDNLFDRDAPVAYGTARGFDAFNHDPYGTNYTLSFSYYFD
ncbi:TonB-dependent receptor domain-containing protein [Alteromonas sp. S167]|uniref:TonB-dependent receptor domain-containing protein n=1 Tax=Alteromonas sp. S167 TaxID=3117402 RepID=UPI002FDF4FA0